MSDVPDSKFSKKTYTPPIQIYPGPSHPGPGRNVGTIHFEALSPLPLTGFEKICIGICFASIASLISIYFILSF